MVEPCYVVLLCELWIIRIILDKDFFCFIFKFEKRFANTLNALLMLKWMQDHLAHKLYIKFTHVDDDFYSKEVGICIASINMIHTQFVQYKNDFLQSYFISFFSTSSTNPDFQYPAQTLIHIS